MKYEGSVKGIKVVLYPNSFAVVNVRNVPNVDFFAMVKDKRGVTVVLPESELRKICDILLGCEGGFRLLTFDTILPFDLVGFISKISTALAKAGIGILVFSSYSTDHILIKENDVERALEVLEGLGFERVIL